MEYYRHFYSFKILLPIFSKLLFPLLGSLRPDGHRVGHLGDRVQTHEAPNTSLGNGNQIRRRGPSRLASPGGSIQPIQRHAIFGVFLILETIFLFAIFKLINFILN